MRRLQRKLRRTKRQALAAGTASNVLTQWRAYEKFCYKFDRHEWPATTETLCLFAQHLASRMRSVKSIESYVYGVIKLHLYAGQIPPSMKDFELQLTLRGLRRLLQFRSRQRKPITPKLLKKIKNQLNPHSVVDTVLWAAFLTAFYLLLRKSNIVPVNKKSFDPQKQLTRGMVKLTKNFVKVKIIWSKTIQYRQWVIFYKMEKIPGSVLCPVKAFRDMFRMVPATKSDPCFVMTDGTPLSYNMFQYHLKRTLAKAGVKKWKQYSTHSFRKGGLQWGYTQGIDKKLLKAMGDWRSSCYEVYLSFPKKMRYAAHRVFIQALKNF